MHDLFDAYRSVSERRLVECYHDALQAREQALQMFNLGYLSLEFRGLAERLYWATCAKIRDYCRKLERRARRSSKASRPILSRHLLLQLLGVPVAARQLGDRPAVPDHADPSAGRAPDAHAACSPTSPATPTARSTASSASATSSARSSCTSCAPGEEYYLAVFLVGAYQETLGDLHNLFGDTHVVHIRLHDEGGWWIEEIVKGDTASRVLEYMQYDVDRAAPAVRARLRARRARGPHDARREPGAASASTRRS